MLPLLFTRLLLTVCFVSLFPVQSSQGVLDLLMVLRVLRLVRIMGQIKRFVSTLTVQTTQNIEKDVFRLVTSVRQRKNSIHHEESNLRPSDSALLCFTTEPQRLYGRQGLLRSSCTTRVVHTA